MRSYLSIFLGVVLFLQIVCSTPVPSGSKKSSGSPYDDEDDEDEKPSIPGIGAAVPSMSMPAMMPAASGTKNSGKDDDDYDDDDKKPLIASTIPSMSMPAASGTKDSGKGIGDDAKGSVTASVEVGNGNGKGIALSVSLGNTQNAVVAAMANSSACPAMAVIFARGTFEPGNVGIVTGPPFFNALAAYMNGTNQLAIQGVDYPADVPGFLAGGSKDGANKMAQLVNDTMSKCPNTKINLSGYSQGAQVVHLATSSLPASTTSKISSIILFGDPRNGTAINGIDAKKVLTICNEGDNICEGGAKITQFHLSYGGNATQAAKFALSGVAMLGITSMDMVRDARGQLGN